VLLVIGGGGSAVVAQVALERVQAARPVGPVGLQPGIQLPERLGPKAVEPALRVGADLHEPRIAQHLQVAGHARLVHADLLDELADGSFAVAHGVEDPATCRLGDHLEDGPGGGHLDSIRPGIYMHKCMLCPNRLARGRGARPPARLMGPRAPLPAPGIGGYRFAMTDNTPGATTLSDIGVAMFTVADQDAALAFYTGKLGFEVRSDTRFGENGEMRWVEVAPPGSHARLALNPPMGGQPGGGGIGVETPDVVAEHRRLTAIGGIDLDPEPMRTPGAPLLFMLRDPDGNSIAVVEPDTM
jgi:lactoylglutathione lyase